MSGDDRPLSRVRRAKSQQSATSRIDGGAIAVGMVVTLGAHLAPALLLLLETSASLVRLTALASTVAFPFGSYVTGRYAGSDWERGGLNGVFAAGASLVVLGASAIILVGADRAVAEFGRMLVGTQAVGFGLTTGSPVLAGTVVFLLFVGIVGGALGAN
ncbi:hypothetical protein ACFFQF_11855 [Haladaptatus pallidirubidus]|uniref:Uncharacterized protein n=1 Tax=Haladaptatus pallidirubidus TaxID=1008152 RepID=A0AAV3UDZ1_9EURY|nr:hypothetical protein [Haladaptatus pallidirubidus]